MQWRSYLLEYPVPMPKQQYVKKLNDIALRYGRVEDETIRQSLAMLKQMQGELAAELSRVEGWEAYRVRELKANIDRMIAEYQARLTAQVQDAVRQAVASGEDYVIAPLGEIGIAANFYRPGRAQINTLLDFSADLVRGISDDLRSSINDQIRRAALGQQSPFSAMKGITQAMGLDARTGIWKRRIDPVKGVAARAETILRTELQRVYNLSTHSQQLATAQVIPGLLKGWVATGDTRTRDSHLRAHIEYKDHPIPVEEPFILKDRQGRAELMCPGDPQAPPRFTINCRCRSVTVHPAVGRIGSSLDGRIAAELKRREKQ